LPLSFTLIRGDPCSRLSARTRGLTIDVDGRSLAFTLVGRDRDVNEGGTPQRLPFARLDAAPHLHSIYGSLGCARQTLTNIAKRPTAWRLDCYFCRRWSLVGSRSQNSRLDTKDATSVVPAVRDCNNGYLDNGEDRGSFDSRRQMPLGPLQDEGETQFPDI